MRGPMKDKNPLALGIPQNIEQVLGAATIFDRENPDSVFNRTEGALHEAVARVEESKLALRNMRYSPKMIRDLYKPEPRDAKLRIAFWEEYTRAIDRDSSMRIEFACAGVCSLDIYLDYISDPEKVGYLLNTPASYMKNAEELLNVSLDRIRDILDLPLINSKGQVQASVVSGILKAAEMLDRRVRGAVMQKVAIHQHHTSGGNVVDMDGALAHDQLASLEKQISDARKKIGEKYAILTNTRNEDVLVEKAADEET